MPPLHHQVVTASFGGREPAALADAREVLENALADLDGHFDETPAGLGITVAWGLPYFDRYVPEQRGTARPGRPPRFRHAGHEVSVLEDAIRFPTDPDRPARVERCRRPLPERLARSHRGRRQGGLRRPERALRRHEHPQGVRRRRLRRRPRSAEADGARRAASTAPLSSHTDPSSSSASPRRRKPGSVRRVSRTSRPSATRTSGPRLLRPWDAHAPLAPLRGPRRLVPHLRLPGTRRYDVPAEPRRAPHTKTVAQGPDDVQTSAHVSRDYARYRQIGHCGSIQPASRLEHKTLGSRRDGLPQGHGCPAARGLQHPRQPVLLDRAPGARQLQGCACRGPPLRRLQPHERRLPQGAPGDGRRHAGRHEARLRDRFERSRLQLGPRDDASPELPRPTARHRSFPLSELRG